MDIKICPDCEIEYRSHVETCVDCGTALLHPEEHVRRKEEKRRCVEQALIDPVVVRQGEMKWIDELYQVLIESKVPCRVLADPSCGGNCRGGTWGLAVSRGDAERAVQRIEEYFIEVHPEAQVSQDRMSQGQCPACGSDVDPSAVECPDCGLTLLIVE
jgi:hypothetical protein